MALGANSAHLGHTAVSATLYVDCTLEKSMSMKANPSHEGLWYYDKLGMTSIPSDWRCHRSLNVCSGQASPILLNRVKWEDTKASAKS